ncbi:MAG: hypothetical protein ACK52I_36525 [Pseudomonadota bacterium]
MSTEINKAYDKSGLLDNIVRKIQFYLDTNSQTLRGLAIAMGVSYLQLYRLFTKKHLPTINSIEILATHIGCTTSELLDEKMFLDMNCFESIDEKLEMATSKNKIRAFFSYEEILPLLNNDFFVISEYNNAIKLMHHKNVANYFYQIFYLVDQFLLDGKYLVEYNSQKIVLDILSASSKYIVVQDKETEKKIDLKLVKPIAKFFGYAEVRDNKIIEGKKI